MKLSRVYTLIFLALVVLAGCCKTEHHPEYDKETSFMLGTYVTVTIPHHKNSRKIVDHVYREIERISKKYSLEQKGSYINKINALASKGYTRVDEETMMLLKKSFLLSKATRGYFDITTGCLKELWGFNSKPHLPEKGAIKRTLACLGYEKIEVKGESIRFHAPEMKIDLGGIAKGYAVDRGIEILQRNGVKSAIIDAGGDIFTLGKKWGSEPWKTGIKNPRGEGIIKVLPLSNKAVATSGDYENYFVKDGVR